MKEIVRGQAEKMNVIETLPRMTLSRSQALNNIPSCRLAIVGH
jgi:hypothetical protein